MIKINQELCIKCELCVKDCALQAIRNKKGQITGPKECMECGHCVAICPKNAVSMEGYDMSESVDLPKNLKQDPDELLMSIKARRSIRDYADKKIGDREKNMIFDAIKYTASAKNAQQGTIIFVQDKMEEFKEEVYKFLEKKLEGCVVSELDPSWAALYMYMVRKRRNKDDDFLLRNAPAIMIIANDNPWDAGLVSQNAENMACALGMGVLFNGYMARVIDQSKELREWLGLKDKKVTAVMLIGYPNVKYQRTVPRKKLDLVEL